MNRTFHSMDIVFEPKTPTSRELGKPGVLFDFCLLNVEAQVLFPIHSVSSSIVLEINRPTFHISMIFCPAKLYLIHLISFFRYCQLLCHPNLISHPQSVTGEFCHWVWNSEVLSIKKREKKSWSRCLQVRRENHKKNFQCHLGQKSNTAREKRER